MICNTYAVSLFLFNFECGGSARGFLLSPMDSPSNTSLVFCTEVACLRQRGTLSQQLNLRAFPFDTQHVKINVGECASNRDDASRRRRRQQQQQNTTAPTAPTARYATRLAHRPTSPSRLATDRPGCAGQTESEVVLIPGKLTQKLDGCNLAVSN